MNKIFCLVIGAVMAVTAIFGVAVEARHHDDWEPEPVLCWQCYGSGRCPTCDGAGEIIEQHFEWDEEENSEYFSEVRTPCNECYGSGQCQMCFGNGFLY